MAGGSPRLAWVILALYFALVCVIALSHIVPLTFDEAWSFLEFSRHGAWFALNHYPLPNNHIAFTALQALVVREEFVAAEPALLRLGNLLCVAALLVVLLHILRKRLEFSPLWAAFTAIALTLCSPLFSLYLFVGRGYLLGSVLLLCSLHFGALAGRRVATALLCALASWTVPTYSFAVPGVMLALLLATGRGSFSRKIAAQSAALYLVSTLILYAPVLGDVFAQRTGWNESSTPLVFAGFLWELLGNAGTFGLALIANALLLGLLAFGLWRGQRRLETLSLLAPVASFLLVAGALAASGITATPFVRTASFVPLFLWLALVTSAGANTLANRGVGLLYSFNVIAGGALFCVTLATGDPQQYPMLAQLSPSPLARADRGWLAEDAEVRVEWDAAPVARLYARGYGFKLKRVSTVARLPCAAGGRYPPKAKNRVAIDRGSKLICF